MTSPAVSVLLPVHNGAAYLRAALDSVMRQTFRDFELIVVDDGSTDESPAIVRSLDDPRIRLIQSSERLRICKALNLGIEHARGRLIARMDADDVSHPRRLERQVRFLGRHPEVGFCGSWVRRFGEQQAPQAYRRPVGSARVRAFAVFDNPLVHSSVMFRRDLLRRLDVAYRDEFADAEDYDLWNRLFAFAKGDNLPEILLDYRVHAHSVTLQKSESMDRTACRVVTRELSRLGLEPAEEAIRRHRLWSTGRLHSGDLGGDLDSAEQWLVRLVAANRESRACDPAAFLWAAREIWFALCYRVLAEGRPILKRYLRSPISRGDLKNGMVLLGALAKRRL